MNVSCLIWAAAIGKDPNTDHFAKWWFVDFAKSPVSQLLQWVVWLFLLGLFAAKGMRTTFLLGVLAMIVGLVCQAFGISRDVAQWIGLPIGFLMLLSWPLEAHRKCIMADWARRKDAAQFRQYMLSGQFYPLIHYGSLLTATVDEDGLLVTLFGLVTLARAKFSDICEVRILPRRGIHQWLLVRLKNGGEFRIGGSVGDLFNHINSKLHLVIESPLVRDSAG